jgi:methionyl-tRNA formyltransferase
LPLGASQELNHMTSFLVVGEGQPAKNVLGFLLAKPKMEIVALVTTSPRDSLLVDFAEKHHIPVKRPCLLLAIEEVIALANGKKIDWLLSANSTLIVPAPILAFFERGGLNLHPGVLPEYAGLHAHQWAIRKGEKEFGATIHLMEPGIDTGGIVREGRFPIGPADTGLSVFRRCMKLGSELFCEVIDQIASNVPLSAIPQDLTRRRIYRHRDILDGRIDWNWPAPTIIDFVRASNYEPFRSPTYVAALDATVDFAVEVSRARIEGRCGKSPGSIIDVAETGLLVACGDGDTVRVTRARNKGRLLDVDAWRRFVAQLCAGGLRGRAEKPRANSQDEAVIQ